MLTANSKEYGILPMFPTLYAPVSEERIERTTERLMDVADHVLMKGDVSQSQYDAWCKALNRWTDDYYHAARFTKFGR